ncbi:MAG: type I-E CRISPR-associated protein Cse1/CasA [Desulfovibrionaceae bacterium]|nr:type I-E CRISPR-associated protein Cse1/CasA [Desulfovibrionaceae bacterium]
MTPFNLLTQRWIPVRLRSGALARIAPWQLTGDDPPVDIDIGRPDFKGALLEFLVGLVQTAMPPKNSLAWKRLLGAPPVPDDLKAAMTPLAPYFNLFGERPLFLQDLTLTEDDVSDPKPVGALLMDSPGENALGSNSDFFVKRDQPPDRLCPACAATALFTLQSYAPSGGAGHRVSLRGGGPLVTLNIFETLWKTVWSNVLPLNATDVEPLPESSAIGANVFAWLEACRDSSDGSQVHAKDVHFLHQYWGTPRRIVLLPEDEAAPLPCPLCGETGTTFVRRFLTKNYGYNYGLFRHPLTPYRYHGADKGYLTLKGVSEGHGYIHWPGFVYGEDTDKAVVPAQAVRHCRETLTLDSPTRPTRIRVYGYDMDNMKARGWCEGEYDVFGVPEDDLPAVVQALGDMVRAADQAKRNLVAAVREALFPGKDSADAGSTFLSNLAARFWNATEKDFYKHAQAVINGRPDPAASQEIRAAWLKCLLDAANDLFSQSAEGGEVPPSMGERVYGALNRMRAYIVSGCGKILNLPGKAKEQKG